MIKTEKVLHLKSSRGRKVRVVREHYLRERVPCFSALCQAGCENGEVRGSTAAVRELGSAEGPDSLWHVGHLWSGPEDKTHSPDWNQN